MMKTALAALAIVSCGYPVAAAVATDACHRVEFESGHYSVCDVDLRRDELRLYWKNAAGEPYRNFSALAEALGKDGKQLVFALNAGMYAPDFSPLGLYVENGEQMRPLNREIVRPAAGPLPNFYKKPNAVFYFGDKPNAAGDKLSAGIMPSSEFARIRPKVRFATQSGPMLVIKDRINAIFIAGSTDRTRRSGVGLCQGNKVRFAASEDAVNFHDFARLFQTELKCANALFLDGGGGAGLYSPQLGRSDFSWHGGYGPMFGLIE